MENRLAATLGFGLLICPPGCGGDPRGPGSEDPADGSGGGESSGDASSGGATMATSSGAGGSPLPEGGWSTLLEGSWALDPGVEGYWCVTETVPEDVYVRAFRALSPIGTHHTLLMVASPSDPDGQYPCAATLGHEMYFASGIGTGDLVFPEGVATKIAAGTRLTLNLHILNAGALSLSGVSGTQVQRIPAAAVMAQAEMRLPGTYDVSIPPHSEASAAGSDTFSETSTIVALWPHMHKYGTHMLVTHESASGSTVLLDTPFSFTEQKSYAIDPVVVSPGESVGFVCTWNNPGDSHITWGDSSEAEMCFLGLYRYVGP